MIWWLLLEGLPPTYVFHYLDEELHKLGYKDGITLRGAPYDFRRIGGPFYLKEWLNRFKLLIEDTHTKQGAKRVHLICHSLGFLLRLP